MVFRIDRVSSLSRFSSQFFLLFSTLLSDESLSSGSRTPPLLASPCLSATPITQAMAEALNREKERERARQEGKDYVPSSALPAALALLQCERVALGCVCFGSRTHVIIISSSWLLTRLLQHYRAHFIIRNSVEPECSSQPLFARVSHRTHIHT